MSPSQCRFFRQSAKLSRAVAAFGGWRNDLPTWKRDAGRLPRNVRGTTDETGIFFTHARSRPVKSGGVGKYRFTATATEFCLAQAYPVVSHPRRYLGIPPLTAVTSAYGLRVTALFCMRRICSTSSSVGLAVVCRQTPMDHIITLFSAPHRLHHRARWS